MLKCQHTGICASAKDTRSKNTKLLKAKRTKKQRALLRDTRRIAHKMSHPGDISNYISSFLSSCVFMI